MRDIVSSTSADTLNMLLNRSLAYVKLTRGGLKIVSVNLRMKNSKLLFLLIDTLYFVMNPIYIFQGCILLQDLFYLRTSCYAIHICFSGFFPHFLDLDDLDV